MFRTFGSSLFRQRLPGVFSTQSRNYLSENYKCTKTWESRLHPEYMQKVELDTLYYDIDQSFSRQGKSSAIDIDIFANKMTDATSFDEVADIVHKLRLTEETSNALQSTGHALIRTFLEHGHVDDLMNILDDRLNYGVFLDHYIANYLLDELIKRKDYSSAARVSTYLMLQEDLDNELSLPLALYSCYSYLGDPKPFYPAPVDNSEDEKPKEEVKVRVKFLRNPFFDDHFDLRDHFHLVGKTLIMIGSKILPENIGKNAELLGQVLYQKYDKALPIFESSKAVLYKDVVAFILQHLSQIADDKIDENCRKLQSQLQEISKNENLNASNYADDVEQIIKDCVKKCEGEEILKQEELYKDWMKIREIKLQEELNRLQRARRLLEVEKLTSSMREEEQKLWFFENEDKLDLQIDSKKVYYPKRWFGKKKKPRIIDTGYVPPEMRKQK